MVFGPASQLGVAPFEDTPPVECIPNSSAEEAEAVIQAVYRQVLGNAYVMESERLTVPESQFKRGQLSVREFIRVVGTSELYQSRFFESCPRYRSIELNFKHFLGRAPNDYEEMKAHSQILDQEGWEAEIDSYLDSDEYQEAYGENIVPYYRGYKTQASQNMVGFTYLFQLLRGPSSSDKSLTTNNPARLNPSIVTNQPAAIIPPSNAFSMGGVTDINKLLAIALPLKVSETASTGQQSSPTSEAYRTTQSQCQEKAELIQTLQQQLAELRPTASFGATFENKWQSYSSLPSTPATAATSDLSELTTVDAGASFSALQQQLEQQNEAITTLEQKIVDARRLASIGDAYLNKWRRRAFSR